MRAHSRRPAFLTWFYLRLTAFYTGRQDNGASLPTKENAMKPVRFTAVLLAAASLCIAAAAEPLPVPPVANEARPADAPDGPPGADLERAPLRHHGRSMRGHGFPHLRGIDLSEAQQDRLFALMHAQAPQLREQHKQERKAREALRTMMETGQFDEAKAAAQAKALGAAVAARELQRVRSASQVRALLTLEQREQLKQQRPTGGGGNG
jgi:periplasmic protein CpxP/Spy